MGIEYIFIEPLVEASTTYKILATPQIDSPINSKICACLILFDNFESFDIFSFNFFILINLDGCFHY